MAARFWVGGTGTWDASDTTHWASSSGGAGGQSVPGTSDTVTLDGSSGGGTVTVNTNVAVQSITCGAFTGTLDFSANNNNVTLTASSAFSGTGTGTRTINLGNGTWILSATAGAGASITPWNMGTTTNLTFNANSSTISVTGSSAGTVNFTGGGLTYATVAFSAQAGARIAMTGANTFGTLTIAGGPTYTTLASDLTIGTFNLNGSSSGQIGLISAAGGARTVAITTLSASWTSFREMAFSGSGLNATNSFDLGTNSGFTITPPSTGGGTTPQQFSMVGTLTLIS